jgi:hypothetical protein
VGCLVCRFPFEGSRFSAAPRFRYRTRVPLLGLVALQSLVDIEVSDVSGYLFPLRARRFQRPRGFPSMPVPAPLRARIHPLLSFTSSSEYCCLLPARCPRAPSAFSRVLLPFATTARGVHSTASFPLSPTFRPQRFARSRRLTPPRTSQACFILQPRPGFALQGFSPLPSRLASSTSRALLPFLGRLLPASCPTGARSSHPDSRALIRAAIRCGRQAG